VRTAFEAMSAVLGGTAVAAHQQLRRGDRLPTEFSARIARNTQLILQEETGVTKVVDPLAGSYYVESLTNELIEKAWALIEEVEEMGGMTKAVESGLPKLRIEEGRAAAGDDRQGRGGDRRRQQVPQGSRGPDRHPRHRQQRRARGQIARLEKMRVTRDQAACEARWQKLGTVAKSGTGNLLGAAVEAARARATCRRDLRWRWKRPSAVTGPR
jgi:methylmalonyl-CoA mutase